jgi:hypothetical protein
MTMDSFCRFLAGKMPPSIMCQLLDALVAPVAPRAARVFSAVLGHDDAALAAMGIDMDPDYADPDETDTPDSDTADTVTPPVCEPRRSGGSGRLSPNGHNGRTAAQCPPSPSGDNGKQHQRSGPANRRRRSTKPPIALPASAASAKPCPPPLAARRRRRGAAS